MDVGQWWDYANSILPRDRKTKGYAVSDTAYDTLREKYFYDVMAPQIAQQGLSPEASKETFMKATGRPGKSNFPRTELVVKSAVKGLVGPMAGLGGSGEELNAMVEGAKREANRQDIGPLQTEALSLVGQGIGMAPYFASPTMAARSIGTALAGPVGRALLEIPTVGALQGLYDAASASDGHRVSAGLEGFATGAAFAGGLEGLAGLKRVLSKSHGLSASESDAVLASMKGEADDVQQVITDAVIKAQPDIGNTIEQSIANSGKVARRAGVPKMPPQVETGEPLRVRMMGADGKEYFVSGFDVNNIDQVVSRIDKHLQMGGEIVETLGSAENLNAFQKALASKMPIDVPSSVKGREVKVRTFPSEEPQMPSPLAARGLGKIEMLNDGTIIDRESGMKFASLEDLLNDKEMRFELGGPAQTQVQTPVISGFKERPLAITAKGNVTVEGQQATGVTIGGGQGNKPLIIYGSDATRGTVFHENLHGHFDYLGITDQIVNDLDQIPHTKVLANALSPEARSVAGGNINEEVATHLTTAVRTNDTAWLERFVKADEDLPSVMNTAKQYAEVIKSRALQSPNSLSQRRLIERMDSVQRRAGAIEDLEHAATMMEKQLSVQDGKWQINDGATTTNFATKDDLVNYVERLYSEPLNAPNLIDETWVPSGVPKFALKSPARPPISTEPPLPQGGKPIIGGIQHFSYYTRPFYAWLDTVARKNKFPELYDTFKNVDVALGGMHTYESEYAHKFTSIFKGVPADKRKGMFNYLANPTPEMAKQLNLGAKDVAKAQRLLDEVITPLSHDMGFKPENYFEYMRQARSGGKIVPTDKLPQDMIPKVEDALLGIDLRDTDAGWIANGLLRNSGRIRHLEPYLKAAENIVNAKVGDEWALGTLRPLLKRHIDFMRTRPDQSQQVIASVADASIEALNNIITTTNKRLPQAMQMPKIESSGKDAFGRMMLFSYAGTMGLRPMAWVRDGMQVLTTTLPILGPKYLGVGLERAFGAAKQGRESSAWKVAREYGALIEHSDIQNLFAAGNESLVSGKATKIADAMLKPMQWSNNSNRLVSFWGHSEKALDALKMHKNDPKQFLRESGLIYADKSLQDQFVSQLPLTQTLDQMRDLSFKIGKEMTDVSQWNYHKGAHPGIYKYALGRLLGQYGTWPLNYIEYGRRLVSTGEPMDKVRAGTLYGMAHGAILAAGEATGIDTASWVFTSPAAYGGGPLLTTAQSALVALDTQSQKGSEARRQLGRQAGIQVPGGLAMENIYNAIRRDDPELYKIMLGFNPLDDQDLKKGLHSLTQ